MLSGIPGDDEQGVEGGLLRRQISPHDQNRFAVACGWWVCVYVAGLPERQPQLEVSQDDLL